MSCGKQTSRHPYFYDHHCTGEKNTTDTALVLVLWLILSEVAGDFPESQPSQMRQKVGES